MNGFAASFAAIAISAAVSFASAQAPDSAEGAKRFSRTIYLVRHGAYDETQGADPALGKGLIPRGREQARLVAARFADLPGRPTSLVTSPMTRARETAAIIGDRLSMAPHVNELIGECLPTARPGDLGDRYKADHKACEERIDRAFAELMTPSSDGDRRDIVVCHGNVIRYWVLKALGVDTRAWARLWVPNASVTTIRIDAMGKVRVLGVGDVGHLRPELVSSQLPATRSSVVRRYVSRERPRT